MSLNELAKEAYENSVEHGWWEGERNFGETIALIHEELSEALKDWRRGRELTEIIWVTTVDLSGTSVKPEGIPIEFADVIIRVLEFCAGSGIDIDTAIKEKMAHNKDRPYRHGGLRA